MNAYYFRKDKYQISAAKFVEHNSVQYKLLSFEFSATASEQIK